MCGILLDLFDLTKLNGHFYCTKTLFHMQIKHRSFTVLIMAIDVQWDVKMPAFSMRLCILAQATVQSCIPEDGDLKSHYCENP
jgi:hypothetical protein